MESNPAEPAPGQPLRLRSGQALEGCSSMAVSAVVAILLTEVPLSALRTVLRRACALRQDDNPCGASPLESPFDFAQGGRGRLSPHASFFVCHAGHSTGSGQALEGCSSMTVSAVVAILLTAVPLSALRTVLRRACALRQDDNPCGASPLESPFDFAQGRLWRAALPWRFQQSWRSRLLRCRCRRSVRSFGELALSVRMTIHVRSFAPGQPL